MLNKLYIALLFIYSILITLTTCQQYSTVTQSDGLSYEYSMYQYNTQLYNISFIQLNNAQTIKYVVVHYNNINNGQLVTVQPANLYWNLPTTITTPITYQFTVGYTNGVQVDSSVYTYNSNTTTAAPNSTSTATATATSTATAPPTTTAVLPTTTVLPATTLVPTTASTTTTISTTVAPLYQPSYQSYGPNSDGLAFNYAVYQSSISQFNISWVQTDSIWNIAYVIVHYTVSGGAATNTGLNTQQASQQGGYYWNVPYSNTAVLTYSFTVGYGGKQIDTSQYTYNAATQPTQPSTSATTVTPTTQPPTNTTLSPTTTAAPNSTPTATATSTATAPPTTTASTRSYSYTTWGGSNARNNFLSNTGVTISMVSSAQWTQQFKASTNGYQTYSTPLLYQNKLYVSDMGDHVYIFDALTTSSTGVLLASRQVGTPFSIPTTGYGCGDISGYIGILSTGVIDPATNTWYVVYRDYTNNIVSHWFTALDTTTLATRSGYPIKITGTYSNQYGTANFTAGEGAQIQRTALTLNNGIVYVVFAGACDMSVRSDGTIGGTDQVSTAYHGWIFSVDIVQNTITDIWANSVYKNSNGGGIWMSGAGMSVDAGNRLYGAAGNSASVGGGVDLQITNGIPQDGKTQPIAAMGQAVARFDVNTLQPLDYFIPCNAQDLNNADQDISTGSVSIMPDMFNTTNSDGTTSRIGVVPGKAGVLYVMNLDNLGGFENGNIYPNTTQYGVCTYGDNVVQEIPTGSACKNSVSVNPNYGLIYSMSSGQPFIAYSASYTSTGAIQFNKAGQCEAQYQGGGSSGGVVISSSGSSGDEIAWVLSGNGFRAHSAVPDNTGIMQLLWSTTMVAGKYMIPVMGYNRAYSIDTSGYVYAFGTQ